MPNDNTYTIELDPSYLGIVTQSGSTLERPYLIARSHMDEQGHVGLDVEGESVIVIYYANDPDMRPFVIGKDSDMDKGGTLVIKDRGNMVAYYDIAEFPSDVNLYKEGGRSWLEIIETITKENANRIQSNGLHSALLDHASLSGKMLDDYIPPSLDGILNNILEFDNPFIPNDVPKIPVIQAFKPKNSKT